MIQWFGYGLHKIPVLLIMLMTSNQAVAQYYYNDILMPQQNSELALYRSNNVKKIDIVSLEADGRRSEGFSCQVIPDAGYSVTKMISKSGFTGSSTLTSWYNGDGRIEKSADSTTEAVVVYTYQYNAGGQLAVVTNKSVSADEKHIEEETHVWTYENGLPEEMLRIRNGKDTVKVLFSVDEQNRVVEEVSVSGNRETDRVYYYYDDNGRISDVVRFNARLQRLVPDFMFEYDPTGKLVQLVAVTRGTTDYATWKYTYLPNGLKSRAVCFSKQRSLLGSMVYEYSY